MQFRINLPGTVQGRHGVENGVDGRVEWQHKHCHQRGNLGRDWDTSKTCKANQYDGDLLKCIKALNYAYFVI